MTTIKCFLLLATLLYEKLQKINKITFFIHEKIAIESTNGIVSKFTKGRYIMRLSYVINIAMNLKLSLRRTNLLFHPLIKLKFITNLHVVNPMSLHYRSVKDVFSQLCFMVKKGLKNGKHRNTRE